MFEKALDAFIQEPGVEERKQLSFLKLPFLTF
jgi:hypothetical protein